MDKLDRDSLEFGQAVAAIAGPGPGLDSINRVTLWQNKRRFG